jgi:hypothetical protein
MRKELPLTMEKFAIKRFNSKQPPENQFLKFESFIDHQLNAHEVPKASVSLNSDECIENVMIRSLKLTNSATQLGGLEGNQVIVMSIPTSNWRGQFEMRHLNRELDNQGWMGERGTVWAAQPTSKVGTGIMEGFWWRWNPSRREGELGALQNVGVIVLRKF